MNRREIKRTFMKSINFKLSQETLDTIKKAIIKVVTDHFSKNKFSEKRYKHFKDYIDGKADEPWEYSYADMGNYYQAVIEPILGEVLLKKLNKSNISFGYGEMEIQSYKNIFNILKSKRK